MGYINPVGFILTREDKDMNRDEMIKWLKENTTREQWFDRNTVFFVDVGLACVAGTFQDVHAFHDENKPKVYVTLKSELEEPITYYDVFEQPVFIVGAEYILHFNDEPPRRAWYKSGTNQFYEGVNRYPASDFGKHFTVELAAMGESPETPTIGLNVFLTHLRNIYGNPNATLDEILDDYRKCADKCDQIAESELPTTSLYDRVLKALGERDVPISGEDHLVGQVKVDSHKAKILDKVVEEFNIPVGSNIIQWLRNRAQNQSTVNRATPRNKYDREILPGVHVDVYDVLEAFNPHSKAIDHAVKKLLCPGQRGVKDHITDLEEAMSSICREIERLGEWGEK